MDRKKQVIQIVMNNFIHDSRVLKESISLINAGYQVTVIALYERDLFEHEMRGNLEVHRIKLRTRKLPKNKFIQLFKFIELLYRIKKQYSNVDIFHCNDLDTLPIGVIIKKLVNKRAKVVYDAHELATEAAGLTRVRKLILKIFEKQFIKYADAVITVSESILNWYKHIYKLNNVYLLRNIPYSVRYNNQSFKLKEYFNLKESDILFIYSGGLVPGRGLNLLLNVFSRSSIEAKHKHIVFMGYGFLKSQIIEYSKKFNNIHYYPAVNSNEVIDYTRSADIGISLIENTCLSYYYSLPNKIFEYLLSDIPIIVSNFPDMSKIVEEMNCGWKIDVDEDNLLKIVDKIDLKEISMKKKIIKQHNKNLGWEFEEKVLQSIYSNLNNN